MVVEKVKHSLELNENLDLHERGWKVQRVFWILLSIFLVTAVLGLFGNGPLSNAKIIRNDSKVEFERFFRFETEMEVKISMPAKQGVASLSIPEDYFQSFQLEKIVPEPKSNVVSKGFIVYSFDTDQKILVQLFITPKKLGSIKSSIFLNDTPFHLHHFIYP